VVLAVVRAEKIICKLCKFILSFTERSEKTLLEDIRTEVVESGQKREDKSTGVNGHVCL